MQMFAAMEMNLCGPYSFQISLLTAICYLIDRAALQLIYCMSAEVESTQYWAHGHHVMPDRCK